MLYYRAIFLDLPLIYMPLYTHWACTLEWYWARFEDIACLEEILPHTLPLSLTSCRNASSVLCGDNNMDLISIFNYVHNTHIHMCHLQQSLSIEISLCVFANWCLLFGLFVCLFVCLFLITGGCEPPCGCWDLNSWPPEEQSVLLTTEPPHQLNDINTKSLLFMFLNSSSFIFLFSTPYLELCSL